MPILDGYNATHLLRHHDPYNNIAAIKRIPIVAMTASAIQGDKEKCERAGMDDYLAKPVKRPVLEQMILKWLEKSQAARRMSLAPSEDFKPQLTRSGTDHSSNCPDHDYIATEWYNARGAATPTLASMERQAPFATPPRHAPASAEAARRSSQSKSLLAVEVPGAESEGERSLRRADSEEKARTLRDAKLIYATEDEHTPTLSKFVSPEGTIKAFERTLSFGSTGTAMPRSYPGQGASESVGGVMALTTENVQKFNHSLDSGDEGMPIPVQKISNVVPALIPGPPPDLDVTMSTSPRQVPTALSRSYTQENGFGLGAGLGSPNRRTIGMLRMEERSKSDWSNSTARPVTRGESEALSPPKR